MKGNSVRKHKSGRKLGEEKQSFLQKIFCVDTSANRFYSIDFPMAKTESGIRMCWMGIMKNSAIKGCKGISKSDS